MSKLILLLGGNQGDVEKQFVQAESEISKKIGSVLNSSALYESEPWGFDAEELFLNKVLVVETQLSPFEVLEITQQIEILIGRKEKTSSSGYSSRMIDIDILFYDNLIINTDNLTIPHPRLHLRNFTLLPLAEICPDLEHPVLQKSILDLKNDTPDSAVCVQRERK